MEHLPSQPTVRDNARDALRAATLPTRPADRMWGGRGEGDECSICRSPVTSDQLEFELEYLSADGIAKHHVHVHCFTAWERDRDDVVPHDSLPQSA